MGNKTVETDEPGVGCKRQVTPPWRYVAPGEVPPPGLYMVACSSTGRSGRFVLRRQMREGRDWQEQYVPHRNSTVSFYAFRDLTDAERAAYEAMYWGEYERPAPPPLPAG